MRIFFSIFVLASTALLANPQGFQPVAGEAICNPIDADTIEISIGSNAIIEWDSFSIDAHESTRFIMTDPHLSVLNRVSGGEISHILGVLDANGQVFLINPKGVLVGEGAKVNTASFIASSFDILNEDFLSGNVNFCFSDAGNVINLGTIIANEVQLVSKNITNLGTIDALKVQENNGRIFLVASESTDHSGILSAPGGEIRLLGKNVVLNDGASVDVSDHFGGGVILIGGDYQGKNSEIQNAQNIFVHQKATIAADAFLNGDGGKVILWGDKQTHFFGNIFARGGAEEGNGGFVEVSSEGFLNYQGLANTTAPQGVVGTLLLDPTKISISQQATFGLDFDMPECPMSIFCTDLFDAILNVGALQNQLGLSAVVVAADNIVVLPEAHIRWSSGNGLSFNANNKVKIHSSIQGNGPLTMTGKKVVIQNTGETIIPEPIFISAASITIESTDTDVNFTAGNKTLSSIVLESESFINLISARDFNVTAGSGMLAFVTVALTTGTQGCVANSNAMDFDIVRNWNINPSPPNANLNVEDLGQGSFVGFSFNGGQITGNVGGDIAWNAGQNSNENGIFLLGYDYDTLSVQGSTTLNGDITRISCSPPPPPQPPPPAPAPV